MPDGGARCLEVLMDALKKWSGVPATVSDILAILWELLWFEQAAAAPALAHLEHGQALLSITSVLKSYLHMRGETAEDVVKNAVGVLFQLDPQDVCTQLEVILLGGSVRSDEEATNLVNGMFAALYECFAAYAPKTLPSLVAAMKMLRRLLSSVLPCLSPTSQRQHVSQLRRAMVAWAAVPELQTQVMPLCESILGDYLAAASASAGSAPPMQAASLSS
jgi:hypothetical protein